MPAASLAAAVLIAVAANDLVKGGYAVAFGGWSNIWRAAMGLAGVAILGFCAAAAYALL